MSSSSADRKHALVTGAAGFIGSHLVDLLLEEGWKVTGLDNFDPYYDRSFKERNISSHLVAPSYRLVEADIRDHDAVLGLCEDDYDVIVHLAAKAGVRPSIDNPLEYQEVNVSGTQNVLELARVKGVKQFVFASSSSVYGVSPSVPWSEDSSELLPISPYASTKLSGELLGHVYSHLFGITFVALRYFTVYGPRQRPDLAIHKFANLIQEGKPITMYGDGTTRRDYTFVGDIVAGTRSAMDFSEMPYAIINLGNDRTVSLAELISGVSSAFECEPEIIRQPEQPGDVPQTWANIGKAKQLLGYAPATALEEGLQRFRDWYLSVGELVE